MALSLHYLKRVLYSCSCSQPAPLTDLYFCRHCKVARCQDCVSITVDTYFCPHCFETVPVSEAKNRKNRCNHCFQCPRCSSTLTTRSIIVPSEVLAEQSPKKTESPSSKSPSLARSPGGTKSYYLSCTHCKWSTRDVGIKDKRSPIDFKDPPSPHQERVSQLVSFYKEFSMRDQAEREKAKKVGRRGRSYGGLLDTSKFVKGVSSDSPTQLRRASLQGTWNKSVIDKMAVQSTDCPDQIPDGFYSGEPELKKIAMLQQRLLDPAHQPVRVEQFTPRPLHLIGKKLLRCKGCDHILLKAEINPSSIRFKIQQIALHTFPQIRIFKPPSLVPGVPCEVLLSVSNPVNHVVSISFQQLEPSFTKGGKVSLAPVSLPNGSYQLSPNDDMGDLLDDSEEELEGEKEFIHSRLLGKLVLKFNVTPEEGMTGEVKFGFVLSFDYKSTMELEKQESSCIVPVSVVVDLGKLTPSDD
jgi:dynactin-4